MKIKGIMEEEMLIASLYSEICCPDSTVIDIGANTGFHTKQLLKLCTNGNVYAVEANPAHTAKLGRLSSQPNMHLIDKAVVPDSYCREEFVDFKVSDRYHGRGGVAGFHIWERIDPSIPFNRVRVPCIRFDALLGNCRKLPIFIKMDIEGLEYSLVYHSACLKRLKPDRLPCIAMENSVHGLDIAKISFDDLNGFLTSAGYLLVDSQGTAIESEEQRRKSGQTTFLLPLPMSDYARSIIKVSHNKIYGV
jgi:FkbM family methyltransferase